MPWILIGYDLIVSIASATNLEEDLLPPVIEISQDEAVVLLDQEARRLLGISGAEFERRFRAGELWDQWERREVRRVAFYLPGDCHY